MMERIFTKEILIDLNRPTPHHDDGDCGTEDADGDGAYE